MSSESGTTTCATCGSPVVVGAPFCAACGAPVSAAPPTGTVPERPVPVATAFVPSPIGRRFGAYVIDTAWSAVLSGILNFGIAFVLVRSAMTSYSQYTVTLQLVELVPALTGLVIGLILVAFVGAGATPGMRLVGIRVARFDGGGAPGFGKALGRQLVLVLSGFIIVGPFSPLFDRSGANRGWHDTASGTWVVLRDRVAAPQVRPPDATPATAPRPAAVPVDRSTPTSPTTPIERPVAPAQPVVGAAVSAPIARPPGPPARSHDAPVVGTFVPSRGSVPPPQATGGLVTGVPGVSQVDPAEEDRTMLRRSADTLRLRFADGDEPLDGSSLVGRDPAPRPGETVDRLITPSDAVRSMSKTHARIDVVADGIWLTDRGSTNGTRIAGPGGWTVLTPNVRTALAEGVEIEFGSVRATVVR